MARYLHLFDSASAFTESYDGNDYHEPWVSYTEENEHVDYNKDPSQIELTFEFLSDGYFNINTEFIHDGHIEYSINNGTWNTVEYESGDDDYGTECPLIVSVVSGDKMKVRGTGTSVGGNGSTYPYDSRGLFSRTYEPRYEGEIYADFKVYGNILSLINNSKTLVGSAFYGLFSSNESLVDAKGLVFLKDTEMSANCYYAMFKKCENLISAPKLPSLILSSNCYQEMFAGCTSLTTAPELPATTLAYYCYSDMFRDCTSLTTAPELPATTLAEYCYYAMFYECTSLTTAPALAATTLEDGCYQTMFYGCTSLTTAPELPATTLAQYCYYRMFYGCTSLTTAPSTLPATTLAEDCYSDMFHGCTSLTTAPELPATTLVSNCYNSMFQGCTSLNYIKCLATNISASNCTHNWVNGVASSGTFVKNPNMTSWTTGSDGIPRNWTVQVAS